MILFIDMVLFDEEKQNKRIEDLRKKEEEDLLHIDSWMTI